MAKRVIVGLILTALFFGILFWGETAQVIGITICALMSVYEMGNVLKAKEVRPYLQPSYCFALFSGLLFFTENVGAIFFIYLMAIMAVMCERIFNNKKRTTRDSLYSLLPLMYPLPFFVVLMVLSAMFSQELSITAIVLTFAGPLLADTTAFFVGSFLGKHKLCPEISPKKTVEGGVGAIIGGILGGVFVFYLQNIWGTTIPLLPLIIIGALTGVFGQLGDLFASSLKRYADIKDFGTLLPGHGGILDRLDSVLFSAPLVLTYFYFFH